MTKRIDNFKKLIKFFETKTINYALLGRKDSLNEIIDGDIDIVVSQDDFKNIESLLDLFCKQNDLLFIQNIQHESTAKYMIVSDKRDHSIICPDICSHFVRDARLLINNDLLLNNTISIEVEGLKVSSLKPQHEFLYYFLKKIDKANLNNNEFNHLLEQYDLAKDQEIKEILKEYFCCKSIKKIVHIFQSKNAVLLSDFVLEFKIELHRKNRVKLAYFVKDKFLKLRRAYRQTGIAISIMGPDGCGKSTVIDGLKENLKPAFRQVHYYHLKPIDKKNNIADVDNPHNQVPYSFLKSLTKLGYLVFQYNKGYLKVTLRLIRSTLVIFDRYYDDILVDKIRFRYGAPIIFAKITSLFIPKPKLYFFLDAPGEVIFKRKAELSVKEIDRQIKCYTEIFENKKNHFIIDASQGPNSVIFDVEEIILNYLNKRQSLRF